MGQGGVGLVYVIASVRDARVCVCVYAQKKQDRNYAAALSAPL